MFGLQFIPEPHAPQYFKTANFVTPLQEILSRPSRNPLLDLGTMPFREYLGDSWGARRPVVCRVSGLGALGQIQLIAQRLRPADRRRTGLGGVIDAGDALRTV